MYIYVLLSKKLKTKGNLDKNQDLRQLTCKLLQKTTKFPIFPAHPSYCILIENSSILFESKCSKCKREVNSIAFSELVDHMDFTLEEDQFYLPNNLGNDCIHDKEEEMSYFSQMDDFDDNSAKDFEDEMNGYVEDIKIGLAINELPETLFSLQHYPEFIWERLSVDMQSKILQYIENSSVKEDYFLFLLKLFAIPSLKNKVISVINNQRDDAIKYIFRYSPVESIIKEFLVDPEIQAEILIEIYDDFKDTQRKELVNNLLNLSADLFKTKEPDHYPKLIGFLRSNIYSYLFDAFWAEETFDKLPFKLDDLTIKSMWNSTFESKLYSKIYQILKGKIKYSKVSSFIIPPSNGAHNHSSRRD
jgi:hypothetical protein